MNAAREEILARIRRYSVSGMPNQAVDYAAIPREYRLSGNLDTEQTLRLFQERLQDYEANVYCCPSDRIPETIAAALSARGKKRLVVPESVPASWLPNGFEFVRDAGLSYEGLNAIDGVVTTCAAAIALTGTILLEHTREQGKRSITLIPDYHLCVVFTNQVVETVPEGLRRVGNSIAPITTISGPSATSDIEMTRVRGVHGPRHLDVIVVQTAHSRMSNMPAETTS